MVVSLALVSGATARQGVGDSVGRTEARPKQNSTNILTLLLERCAAARAAHLDNGQTEEIVSSHDFKLQAAKSVWLAHYLPVACTS